MAIKEACISLSNYLVSTLKTISNHSLILHLSTFLQITRNLKCYNKLRARRDLADKIHKKHPVVGGMLNLKCNISILFSKLESAGLYTVLKSNDFAFNDGSWGATLFAGFLCNANKHHPCDRGPVVPWHAFWSTTFCCPQILIEQQRK